MPAVWLSANTNSTLAETFVVRYCGQQAVQCGDSFHAAPWNCMLSWVVRLQEGTKLLTLLSHFALVIRMLNLFLLKTLSSSLLKLSYI